MPGPPIPFMVQYAPPKPPFNGKLFKIHKSFYSFGPTVVWKSQRADDLPGNWLPFDEKSLLLNIAYTV